MNWRNTLILAIIALAGVAYFRFYEMKRPSTEEARRQTQNMVNFDRRKIDGIIVELHPGGRFETLMLGEHGSHRMVATFTDVVPPERLSWVEPASGMHTTSTLNDLGDGRTAVVIHQRYVPEAMRMPEARAGFLTSLDKLEEHLAHLMQGDRP